LTNKNKHLNFVLSAEESYTVQECDATMLN